MKTLSWLGGGNTQIDAGELLFFLTTMSINSPEKIHPTRFPTGTKRKIPHIHQGKRSKHSWRRRLQYWYWRLVRLQGQPDAIARGLACGVFAGLFPIFGLQTIVGVFLAILLGGNKILAAAGTWISNPLTYVPIYGFNFHVGKWSLNQHDEFTNAPVCSLGNKSKNWGQKFSSPYLSGAS